MFGEDFSDGTEITSFELGALAAAEEPTVDCVEWMERGEQR